MGVLQRRLRRRDHPPPQPYRPRRPPTQAQGPGRRHPHRHQPHPARPPPRAPPPPRPHLAPPRPAPAPPLLPAPTSSHLLAHPDAELATARGASLANTILIASTTSNRS